MQDDADKEMSEAKEFVRKMNIVSTNPDADKVAAEKMEVDGGGQEAGKQVSLRMKAWGLSTRTNSCTNRCTNPYTICCHPIPCTIRISAYFKFDTI
jgi:hypothetical protein